jgi:hypothetical protein
MFCFWSYVIDVITDIIFTKILCSGETLEDVAMLYCLKRWSLLMGWCKQLEMVHKYLQVVHILAGRSWALTERCRLLRDETGCKGWCWTITGWCRVCIEGYSGL